MKKDFMAWGKLVTVKEQTIRHWEHEYRRAWLMEDEEAMNFAAMQLEAIDLGCFEELGLR